jgi:hypothetical protein
MNFFNSLKRILNGKWMDISHPYVSHFEGCFNIFKGNDSSQSHTSTTINVSGIHIPPLISSTEINLIQSQVGQVKCCLDWGVRSYEYIMIVLFKLIAKKYAFDLIHYQLKIGITTILSPLITLVPSLY